MPENPQQPQSQPQGDVLDWRDIAKQQDYQDLLKQDPEAAKQIRLEYVQKHLVRNPDFLALPPQQQTEEIQRFIHQTLPPPPLSKLWPGPGYIAEAGIGAAKGLGHTAWELADMATRPYAHWSSPEGPEFLKPQTPWERGGYTAEQIGEYLLPSTEAEKAVTKLPELAIRGAPLATKALRQGIRAAAQGIGAGTVAAIQTGKREEGLKTGALTAAGTLGLSGLGAAVEKLGLKTAAQTIRPSVAATRMSPYPPGEAPDRIIKSIYDYKLGGNLPKSLEKTETALNQLVGQLENELRRVPGQPVDLMNEIAAVYADMQAKIKTLPLTTVEGMDKAFDWFLDGASKQFPTGKATLAEAQAFKRSLGRVGSWFYGMRDPRAGAIEEVANRLYTRLRTTIETLAPPDAKIRDINRQISELIPVEKALIDRIPVVARNNLFSLTDFLTMIPGVTTGRNWWLFGINRAMRYPSAANVMVKTGRFVPKYAPYAATGGAGIAAVKGQLPRPPNVEPAPPNPEPTQPGTRAAAPPPPTSSDEYMDYLKRRYGSYHPTGSAAVP
jgi:hypothetical protein